MMRSKRAAFAAAFALVPAMIAAEASVRLFRWTGDTVPLLVRDDPDHGYLY